jgi:hydroxyacylglutathione hydrolase
MSLFTVHTIPTLKDNYVWLLQASNTQSVIVVDPGDAAPVLAYIEAHDLIPVALLITHHHYDHVDGILPFLQSYDVPVFGPKKELIPAMTHALSTTQNLQVHRDFPAFRVLELPGHTKGHLAYLTDDCLFCGDTLFSAGCGRLLGGTAAQLFSSLEAISQLPLTTKIYCTHEYTEANLRFANAIEPDNTDILQRQQDVSRLRQNNQPSLPSSLALELKTNPFLRCHHPSVIKRAEQFSAQRLFNELAVFTALRQWKDIYS